MMRRVRFTPFWRLTRWGFVRPLGSLRACDEFHNRSVYVVVPVVGELVLFWEPRLTPQEPGNEHVYGFVAGEWLGTIHPDCRLCDEFTTDR